jgi:hypothetical protein
MFQNISVFVKITLPGVHAVNVQLDSLVRNVFLVPETLPIFKFVVRMEFVMTEFMALESVSVKIKT